MPETLTLPRAAAGVRQSAAQFKLHAARLWGAHPRETLGVGVLGLSLAAAVGAATYTNTTQPLSASATPPAPPPMLVRQIPVTEAIGLNQRIPVAQGPNPAAAPFRFRGDRAARVQALECLASAVYYEAGSQDANGERAVAQVVLNRVRHSAFPANVCGVVYQGSTRATGCQFTFTCDGSLYRRPDAAGWKRASAVAEAALTGFVYAPVGWATHYHANYVVPYWAATLAKNAVVGAHIFYRWAGGWGASAAFGKHYSGVEPNAAALRNLALIAEANTSKLAQAGTVADMVDKIPGAEPLDLTPSMRGDKRVGVRFKMAARKAADEAVHKEYVEKFEASDNLRWTLSGEKAAPVEKPLGQAASPAPAIAAAGTQP